MNFTADLARDGVHRFNLRPFGELVDGDVEVAVAPAGAWEGSQDVQPPDREGPGERDGLEPQCGLVDLLGVKLARLAGLDNGGCILKY